MPSAYFYVVWVFELSCTSAAKRLYASTLELQYSACVSPYKCLLHIFMLYGYLSLAALVGFMVKQYPRRL